MCMCCFSLLVRIFPTLLCEANCNGRRRAVGRYNTRMGQVLSRCHQSWRDMKILGARSPNATFSLRGMGPLNVHDVVCQVNNGNRKVLTKFTIWETIWMATISKHRRVTKSKYTWNNFTHDGSMGLVDVLEVIIHNIWGFPKIVVPNNHWFSY